MKTSRMVSCLQAVSLIMLATFLVSCQQGERSEQVGGESGAKALTAQEEDELFTQASSLFGALPATMPGSENDTKELVELGRKLYFEKRLSLNDEQSCNSCHLIDNGRAGVDNLTTSPGAKGELGDRNSPTVLNAGYHFVQFWDGRATDLVEQAKGPILNPVEMAMPTESEVERKLSRIDEYKNDFARAFPKVKRPITYHNIASAIAAFERTLISRSRFDAYMEGNRSSLSNKEKLGLRKFIDAGCITCHVQPTIGGTMYQKLGLVNAYESSDAGRYMVTKDPADSLMFKVPSLRNINLTHPYFHDGSIATLDSAVSRMAWHQLGKKLSDDEIDLVVTFLGSLSEDGRSGGSP